MDKAKTADVHLETMVSIISGVPGAPGEYQFEVKVTDSLKGTKPQTLMIIIKGE
jgi:hypothetical protein